MTVREVRVRELGDVAVVHGRWELVGQTTPQGRPAGGGAACWSWLRRGAMGGAAS
jgi:ketosteroid isomerase-like protein